MRKRYSDVHFLGLLRAEELARVYAACDGSVLPSRTDTFGIALLKALASGLPAPAFPVTGPRVVITDPRIGVLDDDLGKAAMAALKLNRKDARRHAPGYTWQPSADTFRNNILIANHRDGTTI